MPLTPSFITLPLSLIHFDRADRQRREIDVSNLAPSIKLHGVINPIIVSERDPGLEVPPDWKPYLLVAGERRFTACQLLGLETIPARLLDSLDPQERQIIELEENLKRSDLPWRDMIRAVAKLHDMYSENPEWTVEKTAAAIPLSERQTFNYLRIARDLDSKFLENATGVENALRLCVVRDQRAAGDAEGMIADAFRGLSGITAPPPFEAPEPAGRPENPSPGAASALSPSDAPPPPPSPPAAPASGPQRSPFTVAPYDHSILHTSFLDWASTYSGPRFNFVHCDFPYGAQVFSGTGKTAFSFGGHERYEDEENVYWDLIKCMGENLDRLFSPSAHLFFWFDMVRYRETLDAFAKHAPRLVFQPVPCVWVKSDNAGIPADPNRRPKRNYETAFIASLGDRFILKTPANAYSAPTDRSLHPTAKPEPVLNHFFTMFVDTNTRLLDPTCGGGSALRSAERLGAEFVLGLESNPETAEIARGAMKKFRVLRDAERIAAQSLKDKTL